MPLLAKNICRDKTIIKRLYNIIRLNSHFSLHALQKPKVKGLKDSFNLLCLYTDSGLSIIGDGGSNQNNRDVIYG